METKPKKSICRVCLTADTKSVSLLEQHKDLPIYLHINSIANIEIKEHDGLPDKICTNCLLDLDTAISFRNKCENSNLILQPSPWNTNEVDIKYIVVKKEEPHNEIECLEVTLQYEPGFTDDEEVKPEIDEIKPSKKLNKVELGLRESRAIDMQLQCDDCKEFFKSKCKLKVHWKTVHLKDSLKCLICKRTFKSYKAYNTHKQSKKQSCIGAVHFRIEGEGKKRLFYCKECDYKSSQIKYMLAHRIIHTGDRKFKCDVCFKSFGQLGSLNTHKEALHPEYSNAVACPHCAKMFPHCRMTSHLKTHVDEKLPCPKCDKKLKNKKTLETHMIRHSGVKSFTCELCAKTFYTFSDLSNHKRANHFKRKRKDYFCDQCDYKCHFLGLFKIHKAKHGNSKYMACDVCGVFFQQIDKLKLHRKRHFEEKRYSCPHCEAKFHHRGSKFNHIKRHHCPLLGLTKQLKVEKDEV